MEEYAGSIGIQIESLIIWNQLEKWRIYTLSSYRIMALRGLLMKPSLLLEHKSWIIWKSVTITASRIWVGTIRLSGMEVVKLRLPYGDYTKMYSTEGVIRVTFVLYHSSLSAGERVSDSFCTAMDIVPTFLHLARVKHPGTVYRGRRVERLREKSWRAFLMSERTRKTQIHDEDYVTGRQLVGTCCHS